MKNIRLEKGANVAERVSGTCYRKVVSFFQTYFPSTCQVKWVGPNMMVLLATSQCLHSFLPTINLWML